MIIFNVRLPGSSLNSIKNAHLYVKIKEAQRQEIAETEEPFEDLVTEAPFLQTPLHIMTMKGSDKQ